MTTAIDRLRRGAHVHSDFCFDGYQPCGEHHVHDNTCGSRPLLCRQREDKDLVEVLAAVDAVIARNLELERVLAAVQADANRALELHRDEVAQLRERLRGF